MDNPAFQMEEELNEVTSYRSEQNGISGVDKEVVRATDINVMGHDMEKSAM